MYETPCFNLNIGVKWRRQNKHHNNDKVSKSFIMRLEVQLQTKESRNQYNLRAILSKKNVTA